MAACSSIIFVSFIMFDFDSVFRYVFFFVPRICSIRITMPKADKKKEVKNGKKKESKNDKKKEDDVKGEEPEKEEKVSRPELVGTAALDAKKSSPEMRRRLLDPEEEECDTFVVGKLWRVG